MKMRRIHDMTVRRISFRPAALAVLAAGAVAFWGCQSSTQFDLSEYEKLRARHRAESAQRRDVEERPAPASAVAPATAQSASGAPAASAASRPARPAAAKPQSAPVAAPSVPAKPKKPVAPVEPPVVSEPEPMPATEPAPVPAEEPDVSGIPEVPRAEPEPEPVVEVVPAPEPPAPAAPAEPAVVPPPAAPVRPSTVGVYTLAKGDVVQIMLRGIPEAQQIEDIVDEYGMVSLPFINEILAEGLTSSELEQRIRNKYRDDQIYPNVTVSVLVPTRYYYMQGEIRAPGKVQLVSATRLSQAIAASGGGTEFWNGKVQVRRNGEIVRIIKNAKSLEKSPADDIFLEPGDIVELMRSIFF